MFDEDKIRDIEAKMASHKHELSQKKMKRWKHIEKLYERGEYPREIIERIAKEYGVTKQTVRTDFHRLGIKLNLRKNVPHFAIKKQFLDGVAPKVIADDLGICLKSVYQSINKQVDTAKVRKQKMKMVYDEYNDSSDTFEIIASRHLITKSTAIRYYHAYKKIIEKRERLCG